MGMSDRIGSLEVGKRADVIVVTMDSLHAAPATDHMSALVYAVKAGDVRHVLVDGRPVVRDGERCSRSTRRAWRRGHGRKHRRHRSSRGRRVAVVVTGVRCAVSENA